MTINDKHLEKEQPKSGDHQIAGAPITKTEDNALKQHQEIKDAIKSYRLTKGENPFTIDMGNGEKIQDKRPLSKESTGEDQGAAGSRDLIPTRIVIKDGTTYHQDKDGKWVEEKEKHPLPSYHPHQANHNEKSHEKHHQHHLDGAIEVSLPFSPASPEASRSRDLSLGTENSEKGETPAEAAKHGGLVWHKNEKDGTYSAEPPPGYGEHMPRNADEAWAWARYNDSQANQGYRHPSAGDTLDGKKV
jgi:hypothetical protein